MTRHNLLHIKGIGPVSRTVLEKAGIQTTTDLLTYYPRKHDDFSVITAVGQLTQGQSTILASIDSIEGRYVRRGLHITEAIASDGTGKVRLVWFNQPYRKTQTRLHTPYYITGKFELRNKRFALQSPSLELQTDLPVHTARIVPRYKQLKGVSEKSLRKFIRDSMNYLDDLEEILPVWVIEENNLMTRKVATRQLHFPDSQESLAQAKRTMAFHEVFELLLAALLNKQQNQLFSSPKISLESDKAKEFVLSLPFSLTDSQRKVAYTVLKELEHTTPMNRLVEGDVGSGKTIIAALAAYMTLLSGHQTALLAPTEILARQHAESFFEIFQKLGLQNHLHLIVGSMNTKVKQHLKTRLLESEQGIFIGTHALLQDSVVFSKLGLVIVDEQHRFGVEQRRVLTKNNTLSPHILSMTATPIPRSLALTLYGDLDVSRLTELPPGRKPISTALVSPHSREKMYEHVEKELGKGRQAYVVCPLISSSEKLTNVISTEEVEKLIKKRFSSWRYRVVHGKMSPDEKDAVMTDFYNKNIDILIATTVIEVGVNVPNASIMIIEGADRFGLAALHQLRGRIGRGEHLSHCYAVLSDAAKPSERLLYFEQSSDGFMLAEKDLELRGPGAIYGRMQHGALDFRFLNLKDRLLIIAARESAAKFLQGNTDLSQFPLLEKRVKQARSILVLN